MSLVQYLALGKSIENVSGAGRYKVAEEPLVPNFSRASDPGYPAAGEQVAEAVVAEGRVEVPIVVPASGPATPATIPAEAPALAPVKPVPALRSNGRKGMVGQWRRWSGRKPLQDRQAIAQQRELALDAVRPVKNDLCESDLEAVPMPAPKPAEGQPGWRARIGQWMRRWWPRRR